MFAQNLQSIPLVQWELERASTVGKSICLNAKRRGKKSNECKQKQIWSIYLNGKRAPPNKQTKSGGYNQLLRSSSNTQCIIHKWNPPSAAKEVGNGEVSWLCSFYSPAVGFWPNSPRHVFARMIAATDQQPSQVDVATICSLGLVFSNLIRPDLTYVFASV